MNPAITRQNLTQRRIRIASSMRQDGLRLVEVQRGLRAIADHLESGSLPESLEKVSTTEKVREILHGWSYKDSLMQRDLLSILDNQPTSIDPKALKIREAEEELVG